MPSLFAAKSMNEENGKNQQRIKRKFLLEIVKIGINKSKVTCEISQANSQTKIFIRVLVYNHLPLAHD